MCRPQNHEQRNFIDTIKQLGNSAILIRCGKGGKSEAVYISPEYIAMMEDDPAGADRFNESGDFSPIIYPEDRTNHSAFRYAKSPQRTILFGAAHTMLFSR